jgi:hypothetical protein
LRDLADDAISLAECETNVAIFLKDRKFFKVKTKSSRYDVFLKNYGNNLVFVCNQHTDAVDLMSELKFILNNDK